MDTQTLIAALAGALNNPARPAALRPLAYIRYPVRELQPQFSPNGSIVFRCYRWGWNYKYHGRKPKSLPPIDSLAVQEALDSALPGYRITSVRDEGTFVTVEMEEQKG